MFRAFGILELRAFSSLGFFQVSIFLEKSASKKKINEVFKTHFEMRPEKRQMVKISIPSCNVIRSQDIFTFSGDCCSVKILHNGTHGGKLLKIVAFENVFDE